MLPIGAGMARSGAVGKELLQMAEACRFQCFAGFYGGLFRPPARTCGFAGGDSGVVLPLLKGSSTKAVQISVCLLSSLYSLNPLSASRFFSTSHDSHGREKVVNQETKGDDLGVEWEEEEDTESLIGDGGDGGGVVLGDVKWGEAALSLAREVLLSFGDDVVLYGFRVSPKGYVYVRLDKLTNRFGCPGIDEIENFNNLYKKKLDEAGEAGEMPSDLAIEVSSPGAERLLKVPHDLVRFREMAMWVSYQEDERDPGRHETRNDKVLVLESVDGEAERCVFKLADVKENRSLLGKGRPLNKKQKSWRLDLPFKSILRVKIYIDSRSYKSSL